MIELKKVYKYFLYNNKKIEILKNISLTFEKGEQVCILGDSGSGKSTFLNLIGGLDVINSGEIFIDRQNFSKMKEKEKDIFRRRMIGFIFQDYNLFSDFNVLENILLSARLSGEDLVELIKRSKKILIEMGLEDRMEHHVKNLSGGEAQRVAIARARVNNPKIIIADEPTGNIDKKLSLKLVRDIVDYNKKEEITMIFVTHSDYLREYFDSIWEISNGFMKKK